MDDIEVVVRHESKLFRILLHIDQSPAFELIDRTKNVTLPHWEVVSVLWSEVFHRYVHGPLLALVDQVLILGAVESLDRGWQVIFSEASLVSEFVLLRFWV